MKNYKLSHDQLLQAIHHYAWLNAQSSMSYNNDKLAKNWTIINQLSAQTTIPWCVIGWTEMKGVPTSLKVVDFETSQLNTQLM